MQYYLYYSNYKTVVILKNPTFLHSTYFIINQDNVTKIFVETSLCLESINLTTSIKFDIPILYVYYILDWMSTVSENPFL